mgnify:CR=1 FL=1
MFGVIIKTDIIDPFSIEAFGFDFDFAKELIIGLINWSDFACGSITSRSTKHKTWRRVKEILRKKKTFVSFEKDRVATGNKDFGRAGISF